jgi:hypothetical protein
MKKTTIILVYLFALQSFAGIDVKGKSSYTIDGPPSKMTVNCKGKSEDCVTSSSIKLPNGTNAFKVNVFKEGAIVKTINASSFRILSNTDFETKIEFLIVE